MNDLTVKCIEWIKQYFNENGGKQAVVGVSGGKDSTVVVALCVEALGKECVAGVMMPNGEQKDIRDSERVCDLLGIKSCKLNINSMYKSTLWQLKNNAGFEPTPQTEINIAPRLRMTMLYAFAQSLPSARVANTSNFDEGLVGYATLWGDSVGDFAPLKNLHVSQVIEMGLDLGLPEDLVKKAPSDGLTGKTDEEALGFSYADVESMYLKYTDHNRNFTARERKAFERMKMMHWKRSMICGIPSFEP